MSREVTYRIFYTKGGEESHFDVTGMDIVEIKVKTKKECERKGLDPVKHKMRSRKVKPQ